MKICGLEKFSMVDYPKKIACTVFTYGCNFCCPFCQNARLVTEKAYGFIPESEVFDYLTHRKKMVDAVCVSGGEPTLQPDLADFVRRVKDLGLLVKLDTNGGNPTVLKRLLDENLIDYVAMDVKSGPSGYAEVAGLKTDAVPQVRESIALLLQSGVETEFRTTLIDEFHTERDIPEIGGLIRGAKRYYLQRFEDSGTCIRGGLHAVSKEKASVYRTLLENGYGIESVYLRNY